MKRIEQDIIEISSVLRLKTLYFGPVLMKLELSRQIFSKHSQIPNFMEIRPVGAELFHADRRTDITNLIQ